MSKREAMFFVIGFQAATLFVFIAWKNKVGVFNPNYYRTVQEVQHGG